MVRAKWENTGTDLALSSVPGERGSEAPLQVHRRPSETPQPSPPHTKLRFELFFISEI